MSGGGGVGQGEGEEDRKSGVPLSASPGREGE